MSLDHAKAFIRQFPALYYPLKVAHRSLQGEFTSKHYRAHAAETLGKLDFGVNRPVTAQRGGPALIEITNACNLNCVMCNTKMSVRPPSLMAPDLFEHIIIQLKGVGIDSVALHTVGETFVYKNLGDLLEICRRHAVSVRISTNAQFPDKIEDIWRRFPTIVRQLRFSIDGALKETYEHIRKGGTHEKVMESLDVVHNINQGKPNSRIFLGVDAVISMANFNEVRQFFDVYAKYIWPEYMHFHLINGITPDSNFFRATFPFQNLVRPQVPCSQPFKSMHFTYDGKATLCCRDYDGELTVGDIRERSYMELWNGAEAEAIRAQHRNPETLSIKACQECFGPYSQITGLVDDYVHFLWVTRPELSPREFGGRIVALLENMDKAVGAGDIPGLKRHVTEQFA